MKLLKWKGFLSEKYDFDSDYAESNFQEAKSEYDPLFLNFPAMQSDEKPNGEEVENYFEFVGKSIEGWFLLGTSFDSFDGPYESYEELASDHGLAPMSEMKKYEIGKFDHFKDIEIFLKKEKSIKYNRNDIISFISDLIDDDTFKFASYSTKCIYGGTTYEKGKFIPIGSDNSHIIRLFPLKSDIKIIDGFCYISNTETMGKFNRFINSLSERIGMSIYYTIGKKLTLDEVELFGHIGHVIIEIIIVEND